MTKNYEITERGAQVMEASVNGLSAAKMQRLMLLEQRTILDHFRQVKSDLDLVNNFVNPLNRATSMLIAGGLLKPRDIKMPGNPFIFTMEPDRESFIDYSVRPFLHEPNADFILTGRAPTPIPKFKCKGNRLPNGDLRITAENRTFLSCLALGMSHEEMLAFNPYSEANTKTNPKLGVIYRNLGASNAPRAIALATFMGAIDIDPSILNPDADVMPTIYEEEFIIPAAQMALLSARPINPRFPLREQVGLRLLSEMPNAA